MAPFDLEACQSAWNQPVVALLSAGTAALILLMSCWDRWTRVLSNRRQFPVRFRRLFRQSVLAGAGVGFTAGAGRVLLDRAGTGGVSYLGWICFCSGFALAFSVLRRWPEPLVFDCEGVLRRGDESSRIRWENLSHVREYRLRAIRGIVIHDCLGKQLHVPAAEYECGKVVEAVLERRAIPLQRSGAKLDLPLCRISVRITPPISPREGPSGPRRS